MVAGMCERLLPTQIFGLCEDLSWTLHKQLVQSLLDGFVRFGRRSTKHRAVKNKTAADSGRKTENMATIIISTVLRNVNSERVQINEHIFDWMFRRPQSKHSQWGGAGWWRHAAVVESIVTQTLSQAAAAFHLIGSFSRKGGLQLCPLWAHLLILGLDVILAVLALKLQQTKQTGLRCVTLLRL